MNPKDKAIVTALSVSASIFIVGFILNFVANWVGMQPLPERHKFTVVDTYKGCDVVEYSPNYSARYFYFLHCDK